MSDPLILTNAVRLPEPPPRAAPPDGLPPASFRTEKALLVFQPVEHLLAGLADPLPAPLSACA